MEPLGERLQSAKRPKPDLGSIERQESPWSPFLTKRTCLAQPDGGVASPATHATKSGSMIEISKYLELHSELERLKQQLQSSAPQVPLERPVSREDASTLRLYIETCRQMEQKLSHLDALKTENQVLRDNNGQLARALEDVNLKVQLLVAEASTTEAVGKEKLIREDAEKQIAIARKQRDEASERLMGLQEANLSLNLKLDERQEETRELRTKLLMAESALATCRAEGANLRETLAQLECNGSRTAMATEFTSNVSAPLLDASELEALQLELEELRAMRPMIELLKRDAERIPDLERQNDFLRLELTTAHSKRMNEDALQIQIDASAAVQRQLETTVKELTLQNVKLRETAQASLGVLETLGAGRSAEEVLAFINELQQDNQTLLERLGAADAKAKLTTEQLQGAMKRVKEMEAIAFELKSDKTSLEGVVAQRDAKAGLLEREVVGLKALLSSYQLEDGIGGFDTQKSNHISLLETTLTEKSEYIIKLEQEVGELKAEVAQLNKYAKRLSDEKSVIETRLGRGEVDATQTRVLHFSETPLLLMLQKERQNATVALEERVNELKTQLDAFGGDSSTGMTRVESTLHLQQQQELKMLRHQFQETKVAMDRMKSATEVFVRRYMSSIWNVFGWKVDFEEKNRVKVRYKYWNDAVRASQAVLLFEYPSSLGQKGTNDQLEPFTLLETPFSQSIPSDLLELLKLPNTLPLFIAKLTVHLFEMVRSAGNQRLQPSL